MSPAAQRIAIAEACGWTNVRNDKLEAIDDDGQSVEIWKGLVGVRRDGKLRAVPDYLTDLNAIHEAENVLIPLRNGVNPQREYADRLERLTVPLGPDESVSWRKIHATAAERAEALLRTIEKWDNAK